MDRVRNGAKSPKSRCGAKPIDCDHAARSNSSLRAPSSTHAGRRSSSRTDYSGRGRQAVDFEALLFRESTHSVNDDAKLEVQLGRVLWPFLSRNSSRFWLG